MAIELVKTLQTVAYTLYIVSVIRVNLDGNVEISQSIYESSGHYSDGFLPIITKTVIISDSTALTAMFAILGSNYNGAIMIAEEYLIDNDAYYATGSVVA